MVSFNFCSRSQKVCDVTDDVNDSSKICFIFSNEIRIEIVSLYFALPTDVMFIFLFLLQYFLNIYG